MRFQRALAVVLTAASAWTGPAAAAEAATARPVAFWAMNEPTGARTMVDSSGHGLSGSVGGEVTTGIRVSGATGYRFSRLDPDTPPPHPRHVVIVPDTAALDPGNRDYAVTVRLRTTYQFGNIIQKGQNGAAGGYWKLEAPAGQPRCVFQGGNGVSQTPKSPVAVDDGRWHTVTCFRSLSGAEIWVDGVRRASTTKDAGAINNAAQLSIGGKSKCGGSITCDYFFGEIDYVRITKG